MATIQQASPRILEQGAVHFRSYRKWEMATHGGKGLGPALARAGLAGVGCFAGAAVFMHVVQPDLSPVDEAVSKYVNGQLGSILGARLVLIGLGSLALLSALRQLLGALLVRGRVVGKSDSGPSALPNALSVRVARQPTKIRNDVQSHL